LEGKSVKPNLHAQLLWVKWIQFIFNSCRCVIVNVGGVCCVIVDMRSRNCPYLSVVLMVSKLKLILLWVKWIRLICNLSVSTCRCCVLCYCWYAIEELSLNFSVVLMVSQLKLINMLFRCCGWNGVSLFVTLQFQHVGVVCCVIVDTRLKSSSASWFDSTRKFLHLVRFGSVLMHYLCCSWPRQKSGTFNPCN
jgi:hypothetical protein